MKGRRAVGAFRAAVVAAVVVSPLATSAPAVAAPAPARATVPLAATTTATASPTEEAPRTFEPRGEPVQGAFALIDAPVLSAGTYSDAFRAGESLWFATDLERGQEMTARVTVRTEGVPAAATVTLEWQDLSARRVEANQLGTLAAGQANTLAVSTGDINGTRNRFGAVREPGRYYLNLRTTGFPADVEHAFVLELFRDGRLNAPASGAATATPGPTATPSDTGTGSTTPTPRPAATTEDASTLPPPPDSGAGGGIVLLGAAVLALGGGLLAWLRRRRRMAEEAPPPPAYYG